MQSVAMAAMSMAALFAAPHGAATCASPPMGAREPTPATSPQASPRRGDCLGVNRRQFYDAAAGRYYWRDPRNGRMRWENGTPRP